MNQLLQEANGHRRDCLDGVMRMLKGPMQSSPTGMA